MFYCFYIKQHAFNDKWVHFMKIFSKNDFKIR